MAGSLGHWPLRGYGMWACEKVDGGNFVGGIGTLQPLDRPEPELAYSLDQPFWGQSFATEAATAARDWLFGHFRWLALRASFGPTITRRSALHDGSGRFVKPGADGFANLMGVTLPRST